MKKRKIDPLEEIMSNPYYQLRDDYNYAEKVKGTISFGQYSMKYWALERDIVLDETKSEVTEEMFVKAIMDARKEGEILNDEDEVNGARKIRRKVISHLNIIFCGKAKCKSQIKIGINTQLTLKNIVFFNWILKTKDERKAFEWFKKAAEQGNAEGQFFLGCSYSAGIGVEEDQSKAIEWLEKAAEQENADAQNKLGEWYIGVGMETRKAFELFQKAAENGSREAQRNLGKCYMKGLGVNKLPAEAVKYYKKAAEQGDAEAQYLFATCLFTGNAVTQNVKQAVEYYQKSAQQEYMKAINDLGICYARGIGVPKDGKEALAHFGAAREGDHGFYVADSNMAYCYQNGIGVERKNFLEQGGKVM